MQLELELMCSISFEIRCTVRGTQRAWAEEWNMHATGSVAEPVSLQHFPHGGAILEGEGELFASHRCCVQGLGLGVGRNLCGAS